MKYNIVLADPPWHYPARNAGTKYGAGVHGHYPTMKTTDIAALPVSEIVSESALLFMWTTGPRVPDALSVAACWGFIQYSTVAFVWIKTGRWDEYIPGIQTMPLSGGVKTKKHGGNYTMPNAEFVMLFRRGRTVPQRANRDVDSVVIAPAREHSRKPDDVHLRISRMYPEANKLELFARRPFPGWSVWGNEVSNDLELCYA